MKTVEIPPTAIKDAVTGLTAGLGMVIVAGFVLTIPAGVVLCGVLAVAAAAGIYLAGFRAAGEAVSDG